MREDIKHAIDLSIFPPDLAEVIAAHAAMFGATRMETDTHPAEATPDQAQDAGQQKDTFRPIASQDELDRIVTARLSRERAKYADYDQLKEQAGKWAAAEESQKTELQKATDRAEKAEQALAAAQAQALRSQVAASVGLPAEMAARLQGSTQAELEADAKTLAGLIGKSTQPSGLRLPSGGEGTGGSKDDQARTFFGL